MAGFDRFCIGALALLVAGACVPPLSESGRPCPCAGEFVCCEATQTCQAPGQCFPADREPDATFEDDARRSGDAAPPTERADVVSTIVDVSIAEVAADANSRDAESGAPETDGTSHDAAEPDRSTARDAPLDSPGDARDAPPDASIGPDAGSTDAKDERSLVDSGNPSVCWSTPRKSKVLVLVYNPYLVSKGHSLRTELAMWNDPEFQSVRTTELVRTTSHGLVNYDIVEYRELAAWPKQLPGAAPVDETTFFQGPPPGNYVEYEGGNADYADIFASQSLCSYATDNDVSEVWIWGAAGDHQAFGFDLVSYRFPGDVLPSRAPTDADRALYTRRRRNIPDCGRTVVVLGFSYTVGYDPRLYAIRIEDNLGLALRGIGAGDGSPEGIFDRFAHYELAWPGNAQIGTPAFPPNGGVGLSPDMQAWDYSNRSPVQSGADDWYAYPALTGLKKPVDCTAWGCSGEGYQAWYASHLPHASGESAERGCNNWWKYIADPDGRLKPCSGADCSPDYALGRSCTSDVQCASRHCSCQNSRMICSAAAGPPCPNPNWDLCQVDQDCLSGVCGCNGAPPPKVCLPDVRYPRDCSP